MEYRTDRAPCPVCLLVVNMRSRVLPRGRSTDRRYDGKCPEHGVFRVWKEDLGELWARRNREDLTKSIFRSIREA